MEKKSTTSSSFSTPEFPSSSANYNTIGRLSSSPEQKEETMMSAIPALKTPVTPTITVSGTPFRGHSISTSSTSAVTTLPPSLTPIKEEIEEEEEDGVRKKQQQQLVVLVDKNNHGCSMVVPPLKSSLKQSSTFSSTPNNPTTKISSSIVVSSSPFASTDDGRPRPRKRVSFCLPDHRDIETPIRENPLLLRGALKRRLTPDASRIFDAASSENTAFLQQLDSDDGHEGIIVHDSREQMDTSSNEAVSEKRRRREELTSTPNLLEANSSQPPNQRVLKSILKKTKKSGAKASFTSDVSASTTSNKLQIKEEEDDGDCVALVVVSDDVEFQRLMSVIQSLVPSSPPPSSISTISTMSKTTSITTITMQEPLTTKTTSSSGEGENSLSLTESSNALASEVPSSSPPTKKYCDSLIQIPSHWALLEEAEERQQQLQREPEVEKDENRSVKKTMGAKELDAALSKLSTALSSSRKMMTSSESSLSEGVPNIKSLILPTHSSTLLPSNNGSATAQIQCSKEEKEEVEKERPREEEPYYDDIRTFIPLELIPLIPLPTSPPPVPPPLPPPPPPFLEQHGICSFSSSSSAPGSTLSTTLLSAPPPPPPSPPLPLPQPPPTLISSAPKKRMFEEGGKIVSSSRDFRDPRLVSSLAARNVSHLNQHQHKNNTINNNKIAQANENRGKTESMSTYSSSLTPSISSNSQALPPIASLDSKNNTSSNNNNNAINAEQHSAVCDHYKKQLFELETQLTTEKEAKLRRLNSKLQKSAKEVEALQRERAQFLERIESDRTKLTELHKQNFELIKKSSLTAEMTNQELSLKLLRLSDLENQSKERAAEMNRLKAKYAEMEAEFRTVSDRYAEELKEKQRVNGKSKKVAENTFREPKNSFQMTLDEVHNEKVKLQKENADLWAKILTISSENIRLQGTETADEEFKNTNAKLTNKCSSLSAENTSLTQEVSQLKDTLSGLLEKFMELHNYWKSAIEERDKLKTEIGTLQVENSNLRDENSNLKAENAALNNENVNLKKLKMNSSMNSDLINENEIQRRYIERQENTLKRFREDAEKFEAERATLETKLRDTQQAHAFLSAEVAAAFSRLRGLSTTAAAAAPSTGTTTSSLFSSDAFFNIDVRNAAAPVQQTAPIEETRDNTGASPLASSTSGSSEGHHHNQIGEQQQNAALFNASSTDEVLTTPLRGEREPSSQLEQQQQQRQNVVTNGRDVTFGAFHIH